MTTRFTTRSRYIGRGAFLLGLALIAWLTLGVLDVVPLLFVLPGESSERLHAAAAVGCLLIAAWGFWDR